MELPQQRSLGCSRCRYSAKGCSRCRNPNFKPRVVRQQLQDVVIPAQPPDTDNHQVAQQHEHCDAGSVELIAATHIEASGRPSRGRRKRGRAQNAALVTTSATQHDPLKPSEQQQQLSQQQQQQPHVVEEDCLVAEQRDRRLHVKQQRQKKRSRAAATKLDGPSQLPAPCTIPDAGRFCGSDLSDSSIAKRLRTALQPAASQPAAAPDVHEAAASAEGVMTAPDVHEAAAATQRVLGTGVQGAADFLQQKRSVVANAAVQEQPEQQQQRRQQTTSSYQPAGPGATAAAVAHVDSAANFTKVLQQRIQQQLLQGRQMLPSSKKAAAAAAAAAADGSSSDSSRQQRKGTSCRQRQQQRMDTFLQQQQQSPETVATCNDPSADAAAAAQAVGLPLPSLSSHVHMLTQQQQTAAEAPATPNTHAAAAAAENNLSPSRNTHLNSNSPGTAAAAAAAGTPAATATPKPKKRRLTPSKPYRPPKPYTHLFIPAVNPRVCVPGWSPPVSPYGLLEEEVWQDPWKLLLACLLLNKTSGKQVRAVFWDLLALCPTPEAAVAADTAAIRSIIQPLGLHNKRAVAVQRLSEDFLHKDWSCPTQLYGIGKYAADAYYIFCRGQWEGVQPDDKDLIKYHEWLRATGGLGTGLTRVVGSEQQVVDQTGHPLAVE